MSNNTGWSRGAMTTIITTTSTTTYSNVLRSQGKS